MKTIVILVATLALAGCGKFSDMISTSVDGHVVKCIEGTKYIMMSSDAGLAITPHVGIDGKPKGCEVVK